MGLTSSKTPFRVGLTGGIASGKSTVSKIFERLGVKIIDADRIAHDLTRKNTTALRKISELFGASILDQSGKLDRPQLRKIIFNDNLKKQQLESILHPMVYDEVERQIGLNSTPYLIIVIPLLFETGGEKYLDRVLVVDCDEDNQVERAIQRDGENASDIETIIATQIPREQRKQLADDVIENNGDVKSLQTQVEKLHKLYMSLSQSVSH